MATEILNVFPGLELERLLRRVKFRHDDAYLLDTAEHEVRRGCEIFQAGPRSNKTFYRVQSFDAAERLQIGEKKEAILPDIRHQSAIDRPHGRLRLVSVAPSHNRCRPSLQEVANLTAMTYRVLGLQAGQVLATKTAPSRRLLPRQRTVQAPTRAMSLDFSFRPRHTCQLDRADATSSCDSCENRVDPAHRHDFAFSNPPPNYLSA